MLPKKQLVTVVTAQKCHSSTLAHRLQSWTAQSKARSKLARDVLYWW